MISPFSWLNEPASYKATDIEKISAGYKIKSVQATSVPKTDFWRKPPQTHRDTGHFYYTSIEGDFRLSCTFKGKWVTQYDQAGLMCRLNDQYWIKTGLELDEGLIFASCVVTNPYSDWSVSKEELTPNQDNVYIVMERKAGTIVIRYALVGEGASKEELATLPLRTVNGFTGANDKIDIGIMLCSPLSENGVQVDFEDILIQPL
ncbi:hypothetical protein BGW37DRAFT_318496 [Umbelopsis sp. PMI_123]|nr:hypothetical protein BGW37DRAFT_318496 [Umbelopsis sp. PMI_123]